MTNLWKNFAEYIIKKYEKSEKIVEVGVGKIMKPSQLIKEKLTDTQIILVDITPSNTDIIKDDIRNPTNEIYENAELIYSIRPPEELQIDLMNLADKFNSDLIIKPLSTEEISNTLQKRLKLVNYNSVAFYLYKRRLD